MSVANEALKSVHEVPENPSPVSVSHLQFRPAEPVKEEKHGPRLTLPSLMYAFVLFTFLIFGVLLLRAINHRIQARAATAPASTGVVSGSDVPPTPGAPAPNTAPAPSAPSATTAATSPAATAPATFVAQPPPKPAPYKLQAVFFNPARPTAIIGGKTVSIGDRVGLYHVKSITSDTVTLESGDQTKVLKLQ